MNRRSYNGAKEGWGSVLFRSLKAGVKAMSAVPNVDRDDGFGLYGFGGDETPSINTIMQYYMRNAKFSFTIDMNVAHSVGAGFHTEVQEQSKTATRLKDHIDNFAEQVNLDNINMLIARDVWASGNAFIEPIMTKTDPIQSLRVLPNSAFRDVIREPDGTVIGYYYQWGAGLPVPVEADKILHFKWREINADGMGEGLGQLQARKGMPYKNSKGTNIYRPSYFAIDDMTSDVTGKMVYTGLPRFLASFKKGASKEVVDSLSKIFKSSNPGEHLTVGGEVNISTIGLERSKEFEPMIRQAEDESTIAAKTPLLALYTSRQFSYASSVEAVESMQPLIDMYKRAHKRYIEIGIFQAVAMREHIKWDPHKVELKWGAPTKNTIEEISAVVDIVIKMGLQPSIDPMSILDMIADAGFPLMKSEEQAATVENAKTVNQLLRVDIANHPGLLTKDELAAIQDPLGFQKMQEARRRNDLFEDYTKRGKRGSANES